MSKTPDTRAAHQAHQHEETSRNPTHPAAACVAHSPSETPTWERIKAELAKPPAESQYAQGLADPSVAATIQIAQCELLERQNKILNQLTELPRVLGVLGLVLREISEGLQGGNKLDPQADKSDRTIECIKREEMGIVIYVCPRCNASMKKSSLEFIDCAAKGILPRGFLLRDNNLYHVCDDLR